jgi:hypothetical protein
MCLSFQATREPEIRRIVPPGQPGKNGEDLISIEKKKKKKLGVVVHSCHPSYREKLKIGALQSRSPWAKREALSPKQQEHLGHGASGRKPACKHEALSSNLSTAKAKVS